MRLPSWQAQLSGSKLWLLVPPPECYFQCRRFEVVVKQGDISKIFSRKCPVYTFYILISVLQSYLIPTNGIIRPLCSPELSVLLLAPNMIKLSLIQMKKAFTKYSQIVPFRDVDFNNIQICCAQKKKLCYEFAGAVVVASQTKHTTLTVYDVQKPSCPI